MVVTRLEGGKVLLKTGVLIDRLAAYRRWEIRITCATSESDLKVRLTGVIEAHLDRKTEMTVITRDEITKAEAESRRNLAKIDASITVQRIRVTADVILTVERNRCARRNNGSRQDAIIVAEDQLRTEAKTSSEGEPISGDVTRAQVEIDADIGAFFLEASVIAEKISTCAEIQFSCQPRGEVEAGPSDSEPGRKTQC
jgi:hypothetical protein